MKDHPVVLRLVEIRTYIELRPIDKKLKYQIDKLLKMAKEGVTGEEEDADGAGEDPCSSGQPRRARQQGGRGCGGGRRQACTARPR